MNANVKDLKFTKEHEWVKTEGEIAVIGISEYAQKELGDVVYVELPSMGDNVEKGDACANIESVKAVSDIYSPVSGEIVQVNEFLVDKPETINKDPYGEGWVFKIRMEDSGELDVLMDAEAYEEYLKGILEEK
ncbi:MAG: glycine cleavage system protein GcvH [Acidobacteria bacterium]|jgi:glycine cleavage system H protein|nr:glycine cleavage system protein GcvH [Acidobacteriota bacterium]